MFDAARVGAGMLRFTQSGDGARHQTYYPRLGGAAIAAATRLDGEHTVIAKRWGAAAAIALAATTVLALPALAECNEGETATVTEKILDVWVFEGDTHIELFETGGECGFQTIIFPKGTHIPDTCRKGRSVTATGTKEEGDLAFDLVDVQSISCK